MAANIFKIENGERIDSQKDFISKEENDTFSKLLYFPKELVSTIDNKLKFENKIFKEISFKDTTLDYVTFINCTFEKCLFLDTKFINCSFKNCKFTDCNTSGSKWEKKTEITPAQFKDNFNYIDDANIAKRFYSELINLYQNNHYIDYEKDAKYYYLKSINNLIHYRYKKKEIKRKEYYWKKITSWIFDSISGYGVYKSKLLKVLFYYLAAITLINYFLQAEVFNKALDMTFTELILNITNFNNDNTFCYDLIDSLYFSFITITTIGYGDISPVTTIGQFIIIMQSIGGILLIALSLNMFTDGK